LHYTVILCRELGGKGEPEKEQQKLVLAKERRAAIKMTRQGGKDIKGLREKRKKESETWASSGRSHHSDEETTLQCKKLAL